MTGAVHLACLDMREIANWSWKDNTIGHQGSHVLALLRAKMSHLVADMPIGKGGDVYNLME